MQTFTAIPTAVEGVSTRSAVEEMRSVALHSLRRMYRPEQSLFGFEIERGPSGDVLQGISRRYTGMALIGLATEDPVVAREVLAKTNPQDVCRRLLCDVDQMSNLGDAAVALWAAASLGLDCAEADLRSLEQRDPCSGIHTTVELAWTLCAMSLAGHSEVRSQWIDPVARRLMAAFEPNSCLFRHWPADARVSHLRSHVCCFADLVYPIQALSHYYRATGDERAATVARRCAARMCELQGPCGQWWWHFDVRTGRVVERYPVYAVHQDAMAPMALFGLQDAFGDDHTEEIRRGLLWLMHSPELSGGSLVDRHAGLIWRKVARREPGKLSRTVQAAASRMHPALRVPGLGSCLPPGRVDYESRPYHMGWLLHAWPRRRLSNWDS